MKSQSTTEFSGDGEHRPEFDRLGDLWRRRGPSGSVADAVHGTLRKAIISGVLQPDSRLAEEDLARQFKVSRTPIREAMLRLEVEHLVERQPRRGLVVALVTREEVLELYVVRVSLDALAARLAAVTAGPLDIASLRAMQERIRHVQHDTDPLTLARMNVELHETICRIGRNGVLIDLMINVHDRIRRFPGTTLADPVRALASVDEHDEIIAAIANHDPDSAERLAAEHMTAAMNVRIGMLASDTPRTLVV
jgi:DNA-binding GntR family transcriptional regulator